MPGRSSPEPDSVAAPSTTRARSLPPKPLSASTSSARTSPAWAGGRRLPARPWSSGAPSTKAHRLVKAPYTGPAGVTPPAKTDSETNLKIRGRGLGFGEAEEQLAAGVCPAEDLQSAYDRASGLVTPDQEASFCAEKQAKKARMARVIRSMEAPLGDPIDERLMEFDERRMKFNDPAKANEELKAIDTKNVDVQCKESLTDSGSEGLADEVRNTTRTFSSSSSSSALPLGLGPATLRRQVAQGGPPAQMMPGPGDEQDERDGKNDPRDVLLWSLQPSAKDAIGKGSA